MKKKLFLTLLAVLVLAACQDDKAPVSKTPAEPIATATANVAKDVAKTPVQVQQKPAVAPTDSTVAVTKPAESNMAQSMQAAMHQAGEGLPGGIERANVDALVANKADVAKPADVKPEIVKPDMAVAKKAAIAAVKKAPVHQPAIATKTVAEPKKALAAAPVIPAMPAAIVGDVTKGKSLARKCKACHNFTAKKKVGPGLKGVFGRKAGSVSGMRYSAALATGGWVWDEKNLALWLCDSKKAVKSLTGNPSAKTKMASQRICDAGKQADVIAFLKSL